MHKMNVCYATSDEFTIHTGISLLSLLDNNPDVIGKVFVLDYGMTDASKAKITHVCDRYGVPCQFIWAKDKLIDIGEQTGIQNFRDSFATYSRAFLDLLLPEDVDNVLYIDSDTVVIGNVAPIMDIEMTDKVICGCAVCSFYGHRKDGKDRKAEVVNLLSNNKFYIQCGVLWYSLKNWRAFHCTERIIETTKVLTKYPFADQTLINNALPDQYFCQLPLKYNLAGHTQCDGYYLNSYRCGGFYRDEEIMEALHKPVLIHYCGGPIARPWYDSCQSRRKEHYLHYKAMSPWKDVPLVITKKPTGFKNKMREKLVVMGAKTNVYAVTRILSKIRRAFFE